MPKLDYYRIWLGRINSEDTASLLALMRSVSMDERGLIPTSHNELMKLIVDKLELGRQLRQHKELVIGDGVSLYAEPRLPS